MKNNHSTQKEKAEQFHQYHVKGRPLVLVNVWDAGSAQTIQSTGAKAIATGSWSVAAAHGEQDGEALPFQLVLANLSRITKSVDLPVTIDIEGGYGRSVSEVKQNVLQIIEQTPNEPSPRHLATLGVARISYGPYPYLQVMENLKALGQRILTGA